MGRNILKLLFRSIMKNKINNLINITGLSVGIASCILIILYIQDELSFDTFHADSENIYRVEKDIKEDSGQTLYWVTTATKLLPHLQENFPWIKEGTRLLVSPSEQTIRYEHNAFKEDKVALVDASFFKVFTNEVVQGNIITALDGPGKVVITEEMALKLFGQEDPLGKTIHCGRYGNNEITAIIKQMPKNAHFHFDIMISLASLEREGEAFLNWSTNRVYTYIKTDPDIELKAVESSMQRSLEEAISPMAQGGTDVKYKLTPLTSIHLYSDTMREIEVNGDITYIYFLIPVLLLIILIASVNYAGLAIGQASKRHKEVSVKKAFGAGNKSIYVQFMGETIVISLVSLCVAFFMVYLIFPWFNNIMGKSLSFWVLFQNPALLAGIILLVLMMALLSGFYPAGMLSALPPAAGVRNALSSNESNVPVIRKLLVLFQCTVSGFLIIGALVISQQLSYLNNKDLGLNKENILVLPATQITGHNIKESLKNEIRKLTGVLSVSGSTEVPGGEFMINGIAREGKSQAELVQDGIRMVWVDYDFISTMGLELIQGRSFDRSYSGDSLQAFVINKTAAERFGWDGPIGKMIEYPRMGKKGYVVGLVNDFHYGSLKNRIEPVCFTLTNLTRFISVKVKPDNIITTLSRIEETWLRVAGKEEPFSYFFLEDHYKKLYEPEIRLSSLIKGFTIVAVFLASIGLLGLSLFVAELVKKEISVRKIMGAGNLSVCFFYIKKLIKPVFFGYLLAVPPAYLVFSRWLQNFEYHFQPGAATYLLAGLISFAVAALVLLYQTVKTSLINPLNVIRKG